MTLIAFKTDEETKQQLKEYSQKTHRSVSGAIKYAISIMLSQDKESPLKTKENAIPE